jgi:peroxiredoxin
MGRMRGRRLSFASAVLVAGAAGAPQTDPRDAAEVRRQFDRALARLGEAAAVAGETRSRMPAAGFADEAWTPFHVQRPDRWRRGGGEERAVSDGRTIWTIQGARRRYLEQEDFWPRDFGLSTLPGMESVLRADPRLPCDLSLSSADFDGRPCIAARFRLPAGFDRVLYFDRATLLPAGYVQDQGRARGGVLETRYRDVRVVEPLPGEAFEWSPPADFVRIDPSTPHRLLPVGATAPDVTLPTHDGGEVSMSRLLEGKKALLVDFWFIDCPPCVKALQELQRLARRLEGQGLAFLAVDFGDSAGAIAEFMKSRGFDFDVAMNGRVSDGADAVELFQVPSFPATFLLGPDRTVLWCEVAADPGRLERALRAAGFDLEEPVVLPQRLRWTPFRWASAVIAGTTIEKAAVLVPVALDGIETDLELQLDLGAFATMVYDEPWRQLLRDAGRADESFPRPETFDGRRARGTRIHGFVGEQAFEDLSVFVLEEFGEPLPEDGSAASIGTLGLEFFMTRVLWLDFAGARFAIEGAEVFEEPTASAGSNADPNTGSSSRPIDRANEGMRWIPVEPKNGRLFVPLRIGERDYDGFFFDTGSSMFPLLTSRKLWRQLTGRTGDEPDNVKVPIMSWGRERLAVGAPLLEQVTIGDVVADRPRVFHVASIPEAEDMDHWPYRVDGLLGNALFLDRVAVVDLPRRRIAFVKPAAR